MKNNKELNNLQNYEKEALLNQLKVSWTIMYPKVKTTKSQFLIPPYDATSSNKSLSLKT